VTKRIPATALAAALGLFATGCRGGGTVSGTVTLDGAPLKAGTVTFHPVGDGPAAIGSIKPDGSYELAVGAERSIPPGEYVVTVEGNESASSEAPADPRTPPRPPKRITPDKYASKDRSDLRVTLKAGSNKIPLELKNGA
jgi:hypothetical protein